MNLLAALRRATIAALLFHAAIGLAHDSPIHVVDTLSERIRKSGPSARLLTARAYEYRALGDWSSALADYQAALELDPHSTTALSGLAETLLDTGALDEAAQAADRALEQHATTESSAPFHALKAQSLERQEKLEAALEQWSLALASTRPEIDWYIGQSRCLAELGRSEERLAALVAARKRNPSVVLHRLWITALVESGEFETASREIEAGLQKSRWRSSWLLLRAEVHQRQGRAQQARDDAQTALTEIQTRLHPQRPDSYLLQEVAKAHTFLGD